MGNSTNLNRLEQHLLKGLETEKRRLEQLQPIERLQLSEYPDPDEINHQYEELIRNYEPKNYAQQNVVVSQTAKAIVSLLDEAKSAATKAWEDANLSSDISEIAFAASQSTDDLPESEANAYNHEAKTVPSYEAVMPPLPAPVPQPTVQAMTPPPTADLPSPNQYLAPATGDLPPIPYPVQTPPLPPVPNAAAMQRPPQFATPAAIQPLPPPPTRYPTQDLPPHPVSAAGYVALPSHPLTTGAYPTRDLPPIPQSVPGPSEFHELQQQIRVLNHRALTAETRMRTMERVHREQTTLLESQLMAAVHRAEQAEQRLRDLERGNPAGFGQYPIPPAIR